MKNNKKHTPSSKLFKSAGDTLSWAPTWRGGTRGKSWRSRLQDIQEDIQLRQAQSQTGQKVVRRRPQNKEETNDKN